MGKAIGGVVGGIINDRAIGKGVAKGQAGYAAGMRRLSEGKKQALGYLQPYMDVGQGALSPLSTLLTGRSYDPDTGKFTDVSEQERLDIFKESPDYQFRLQQGQKSLEASQAARGGLLSGRAMLESQTRGQNEAASEYGNYLSRLSGLAGMGQGSAGQAANITSGIASQLAQSEIGFGNISMQGKIARGQNWADTAQLVGGEFGPQSPKKSPGAQGGGGAGSGSFNSALMMAAMKGGGAGLSDKNLKDNIIKIGESESGINIYQFEYKDKSHGQGKYQGVIAQEIIKKHPEAVRKQGDFLAVDYSLIDVDFKEL